MKKIIPAAVCAAVIASGILGTGVSADTGWKGAYEKYLREKMNSSEETGLEKGFTVCDLDGDGTPELIYSPGTWHVATCEILTYKDGKMVFAGDAGAYGECFYMPAEGLVCVGDLHMGYSVSYYLKLNGTELKTVKSFTDNGGACEYPEDIVYEIDNKKVTEKEYNRQLAEMDKSGSVSLGQTFTLSDESIRYGITGVSDYKKAYAAFLEEMCEKDADFYDSLGYERVFFTTDIMGDDTPELFVRTGSTTQVYGFSDGRIQSLLRDDTYVSGVNGKKYKTCISSGGKYLMFGCTADKTYGYSFYRIHDGYLDRTAYLRYDNDIMTDRKQCTYNGIRVSGDTFNKVLVRYRKLKFRKTGDTYALDKASIEKVFG